MQINIPDTTTQTLIFIAAFSLIIFLSTRKNTKNSILPVSTTNELKGLAILGIIFAHIGYYLSSNNRFLFPFSITAGMGVNLFLFLSGYGLTLSDLKNTLNPIAFYKKRLKRVFIPMWIVISIFLLMDFFILKRTYALSTIIEHYLGFFPQADLFINLDSPLWYFTLILFYYLSFPILFWKKISFASPLLVFLASYLLLKQTLPVDPSVQGLYKLHIIAFPVGMVLALLSSGKSGSFLQKITLPIRQMKEKLPKMSFLLEILILVPLIFLFGYTSLHSGVGQGADIEQRMSTITMLALIGVFVFKKIRFSLLELFGIYSYEIYLLHWPILYRYDIFYRFLPAWIATLLYLALFLGLGYLLKRVVEILLRWYSSSI